MLQQSLAWLFGLGWFISLERLRTPGISGKDLPAHFREDFAGKPIKQHPFWQNSKSTQTAAMGKLAQTLTLFQLSSLKRQVGGWVGGQQQWGTKTEETGKKERLQLKSL